jgi:hypothetical protein
LVQQRRLAHLSWAGDDLDESAWLGKATLEKDALRA